MKRFVALLVALLLAIAPAIAEFTPYDYHVMYTANGKYIVYDFPDIMLYLPIEWENAVTVEQTDNGVSFYQTASLEKYQQEKNLPGGGFLFELCASQDESFHVLPAYEYLGHSENVGLHFYLVMPSDYPAYPEDSIRAEYDEMAAAIKPVVVDMARISKSMHFYTDDIEETDAEMS